MASENKAEYNAIMGRIDALWNTFWTGGLTNPLDIIEQITYLMFIRDLDTSDAKAEKEARMLNQPFKSIFDGKDKDGRDLRDLRWSVFSVLGPEAMWDVVSVRVFTFIKGLHSDSNSAYSRYMEDAIFKIPTPQKLVQIVTALDQVYELMGGSNEIDARGDVYEYLLSKLSTSGTNGQFRTPRHIIQMMVELTQPRVDDVICDPACGTAGFLVAAAEYLRNNRRDETFLDDKNKEHFNNRMFTGYDLDRTMLRIAAMNMMSHRVENPNIAYRDSLSGQNDDSDKYSLILTNPPFKGSLDTSLVSDSLSKVVNTKKTELLFLALDLRMLRIGGRCAVIVPDGVLFGSSKAHKVIRKEIVERNRLQAVISMPSGVFRPYAGVSTAILIFTKTGNGGTDDVWFYDMKADGYSLDDKRVAIEENDIPDIISRFRNLDGEKGRERTEKSFMVPKAEIAGNDYDLSINKYRKVVYEVEQLPSTRELLKELKELDKELRENLDILEKMLDD